MADVTLNVQDTGRAGVNVTDTDQAVTSGNNYYFQNDGRVKLLITSTPGCVATVETTANVEGLAVTDYTKTVPATKQVVIGPFSIQNYNDSQGRAKLTVDAAADVLALRG